MDHHGAKRALCRVAQLGLTPKLVLELLTSMGRTTMAVAATARSLSRPHHGDRAALGEGILARAVAEDARPTLGVRALRR